MIAQCFLFVCVIKICGSFANKAVCFVFCCVGEMVTNHFTYKSIRKRPVTVKILKHEERGTALVNWRLAKRLVGTMTWSQAGETLS